MMSEEKGQTAADERQVTRLMALPAGWHGQHL